MMITDPLGATGPFDKLGEAIIDGVAWKATGLVIRGRATWQEGVGTFVVGHMRGTSGPTGEFSVAKLLVRLGLRDTSAVPYAYRDTILGKACGLTDICTPWHPDPF